jgi:predicted deacylase
VKRERRIVRPDQLDVERAGLRHYWVALEHDSIWGDHLIPMTVLVGTEARPGEGLVAFGATHGNEYEGPVALKHLAAELEQAEGRGRVILIPVLNPAAFRAGERDSVRDDRVNLNRAFVPGAGERPGTVGITHRIAAWVRRAIWPHVHVVIDLHAGGNIGQFLPCVSFHAVPDPQRSAQVEETARLFGTPILLVYQNDTPGLLTSEAERLGKLTLGAELGWGCAVSPAGVRHARQGVRAAAILHGQLHGAAPSALSSAQVLSTVERACVSIAPFAGHFEPLMTPGDAVREGETIGLLHDFDRLDLAPSPVCAGRSGLLICQAWNALVAQGQHIAIVGVPAGPGKTGR